MKHVGEIIKDLTGYYSFECSDEGFEGEFINLTPEEFKVFFNMEGKGDEFKFRERLEKMDQWFHGKPYKVQKDALVYVAKWLVK